MRLTKDGKEFTTKDETQTAAFINSGWEVAEDAKNIKPETTAKTETKQKITRK